MRNRKKWIKVAVIVFLAFLSTQHVVFASQVNNSVKDCFQNPGKCNDLTSTKNKTVQKSETAQVGVTAWDFVRMIFATIFVVALLYGLLKYMNKKSRSYKSTQLVENLGGTPLGGNRSVQIVKIGSQIFIVGVGENVQLLKEIEDTAERNQLLSDYNSKLEQSVQPSDIVTKVIEITKNWKMSKKDSANFSTLFKQQLGEISQGRKKLFAELEKKGKKKQ